MLHAPLHVTGGCHRGSHSLPPPPTAFNNFLFASPCMENDRCRGVMDWIKGLKYYLTIRKKVTRNNDKNNDC